MENTITREEVDKWTNYLIGKPCPIHLGRLIKKGQYGNWCGAKTELGTWCFGGNITDEFLTNIRKGQNNV